MLSAAEDARAAEWLTRSAGEFGTIHSMVPDAFEAYARVFHPATLCDAEVRWAQVASANGRTMHAAAEWGSLTGSWRLREQEGLWEREPECGQTPKRLARRLAAILAAHTSAPERCWFAVWDGWGTAEFITLFREGTPPEERARALEQVEARRQRAAAWESFVRNSPSFAMPSRRLHLLAGPLAAIEAFYDSCDRTAPSIWWPDDRAWCVGGDVDLMSTYLGGSRAAVDAVVDDPELEALAVPSGQSVTWEADALNPAVNPPFGPPL